MTRGNILLIALLALFTTACSKKDITSGTGGGGGNTGTTFNPVNETAYAFPGAEGFGRNTTGGRGGSVIEVTSLADNGPGTLRAAITASGPRIVVFKVAGRIKLESPLTIRNGDLTIAGQTAPGEGITITNYTVNISADNIIIRYLRFRLGDENRVEDDALTGRNRQNIIVDHCSLSWGVDEIGSFYDIKNLTIQWSIFSESLYRSVHSKGDHGYGGIWGGQGATFHHNLLAHHSNRNPRINGSRYSNQPALEIVDFRNNVIFNWGFNSIYGGEGGNTNIVNNYYRPGPATSSGAVQYRILQYTGYYVDRNVRPDTLYGGKFYVDGNHVHGNANVSADNWTLGVQRDNTATAAQVAAARMNSPFTFAPVSTQPAVEAYDSVLAKVGANKPVRDAIDARIINEVRTGTVTYGGAYDSRVGGRKSGIIDSQVTVGGFLNHASATPPVDTDKDGMPDAWEISKGLNPNDASDARRYNLSTGYTNVEVYINSL
ncbi:pectate lyase [Aridibaculum aurantiacum]|uniref:pectate lyase n=1 Tax=Aridibaculum aurantiacum TaxID=2810307 RepID=UPI001A9640A9|nr:pectate lyase [Aridibaculum aurantiacum]